MDQSNPSLTRPLAATRVEYRGARQAVGSAHGDQVLPAPETAFWARLTARHDPNAPVTSTNPVAPLWNYSIKEQVRKRPDEDLTPDEWRDKVDGLQLDYWTFPAVEATRKQAIAVGGPGVGEVVWVELSDTGDHYVFTYAPETAMVRILPGTEPDANGWYSAFLDEWDEANQRWVQLREIWVRDANMGG